MHLIKVVEPRGWSRRGYPSSAGPQLSIALRLDPQETRMDQFSASKFLEFWGSIVDRSKRSPAGRLA